MRHDHAWVPPWRPGLPQSHCAECRVLVVKTTMCRGHCRHCTVMLRLAPEPVPLGEQLTLGEARP